MTGGTRTHQLKIINGLDQQQQQQQIRFNVSWVVIGSLSLCPSAFYRSNGQTAGEQAKWELAFYNSCYSFRTI